MIRDVSTRWNSTAELIQRALELEDALKILVLMEAHNKSQGVRLRRFRLTEAEWDLLKEISPLLDVCFISLSFIQYSDVRFHVSFRFFFMSRTKCLPIAFL